MAEQWKNLSEFAAPEPVQNPNDDEPIARHTSLEEAEEEEKDEISNQRRASHSDPRLVLKNDDNDDDDDNSGREPEYSDPAGVNNVTEMDPDGVVENPDERRIYRHHNLEQELGSGDEEERQNEATTSAGSSHSQAPNNRRPGGGGSRAGGAKTDVFICMHLVVFSILGTLARLGLTALTTYPGQPARFSSLWPNFAGSLVLGFLSEGAMLLRHPTASRSLSRPAAVEVEQEEEKKSRKKKAGKPAAEAAEDDDDPHAKKKEEEQATPTPVPLHIGLATGFCGSLTSFSAFMRDCFLALAGTLESGGGQDPPSPQQRSSAGRDFMGVAAVILTTLALSAAGLKFGAHLAIAAKRLDKQLPLRLLRLLDRAAVVLGAGVWAAAVVLAAVPPDRRGQNTWRGEVLFALVLAPLGCLVRFLASIKLNARLVGFPLGTFGVNMLGTLLLAVAWDLQRLPRGGGGGDLVSCQVLQGVEDGFCGCLTTVSTWILELSSLRRSHAYRYGFVSVLTGLGIVVAVMGPLKWTVGLAQPICTKL
ncbi:hypothetical protein PG996_016170 [Apiospora saccharicola]|uniref:Fluoride ion transporter CrcB n=1 Tax=Apiospora saccharicola TaxID=335842 RepID=A0ABR1TN84_9PEZI